MAVMLRSAIVTVALVCSTSLLEGNALDVSVQIPWEDYLARSDMLWDWTTLENLPTKWYHSAFIGNGALGMMVRVNETNSANTLLFVVSSSAVWDDREKGANYSYMNDFVYDRPRLPVGQFYLRTNGEVQKGTMRLSLWDGKITGMVQTTKGEVTFTAIANARYDMADAMLVKVSATGGEAIRNTPVFMWEAKSAQSTWAPLSGGKYVKNPPARLEKLDSVLVAMQDHLSGTAHATAFKEVTTTGHTLESTLYVSISGVLPSGAALTAAEQVIMAHSLGWLKILAAHEQWWHNYYPKSFLSFEETKLESFYWIQMYKLASGTRSDRMPFDLLGPWFIDGTSWPDIHWDLNVQFTYYPVYGANRLDLGESLLKLLDKNYENFINNVPFEYRNDSAATPSAASSLECKSTCYWDYGNDCLITSPTIVGNLVWTCQLYYLHYRYSMDASLLPGLYRLLRRGVNYYVRLQYFENSHYHLPVTFSPEYPGKRGPDTNYDLALYRWGLQTAIHIAEDLLKVDELMLSKWKDSLKHLAPYPVDDNGYQIAADVPFSIGHRHFSHLFMIWPLATMNWNDAEAFALAKKSVDHWIGMRHGLTGFCRPAVAIMSMLLGRPESLLSNLTYLMETWILPNTFYSESENGECGETPPMAASTMQDMIVYSWQGVVHVFAGVDDQKIYNVNFYRLRTQGAFLFSGRRVNGRTDWIGIENNSSVPATEDLLIKTNMQPPFATLSTSKITITDNGDGVFKVAGLEKPGANVVIYSANRSISDPLFIVKPVPANPAEENYWGLHTKTHHDSSFTVNKLFTDFQLRHHRQQPDTIAVEVADGQCLMVDQCSLGKTTSLHVRPCLSPGRTRCLAYCDACEQWWVVHKNHLISMATGQCLNITKSLHLQLQDCPWPVDHKTLNPDMPWPWTPQPSTVQLTDTGVEFFQVNNLFHKD